MPSLILLAALSLAQADTWSSTVGALLARSPQLSALQVVSVEGSSVTVRVDEVIRGDGTLGEVSVIYIEGARAGDRILRMCGHPQPQTCMLGVSRDGLIFFEPSGTSFDTPGHIPPGVTTAIHTDALIAGRADPPPLCVRIGQTEVSVHAGTGAGQAGPGRPIGAVVWQRGGRVDYFDPRQPFYVGNAGYATVEGREPTWDGRCVVLSPAGDPQQTVWIPRGFEVISEDGVSWTALSMEADPLSLQPTPGAVVGAEVTWSGGGAALARTLTGDLQLAMMRGPRAEQGVDRVYIEIFETTAPPGHLWNPRSEGYRLLWSGELLTGR